MTDLLRYRRANKLTQTEAANLCSMSQQQWSRLETDLSPRRREETAINLHVKSRELDPLQAAIHREDIERFNVALTTLSERERGILALRRSSCLCRIAAIFGVSHQAIRKVEMRAIRKVKLAMRMEEL